ncbi:unnamed protein product [Aspergillus oryzae]|uniref:Unnamed protein product n=1 Tax=Aspergillus oryzae TaxID=5062 RepID=A0AAN4YKS3_ASPOZ|nr:unnamed protein product [Aspergillus oryzae]GMG31358.1 unnamed protein product [Aspergillus oryzae]
MYTHSFTYLTCHSYTISAPRWLPSFGAPICCQKLLAHPGLNALFGEVQVITQPPTCVYTGNVQARSTVSQRSIEPESPNGDGQNRKGGDPARNEGLAAHAFLGRNKMTGTNRLRLARWVNLAIGNSLDRLEVENELNQGACHKTGGKVSRKVVMQETLTAHQPEGEVVGSPAEEQEAGAVV